MVLRDGARILLPLLTSSQAKLLRAHSGRLPNPEQGFNLLRRWADTAGLPKDDASFLYLLYLASSSEALFLGLLRRPSKFSLLARRASLEGVFGREKLDEALAREFIAEDASEPEAILASFRTFQSARILLRDLLRIDSFEEVTRELSALADVLISKAFALTYQSLRESMGLPLWTTPEGRSRECTLSVFALGKLGGEELNYASDVDLICFYRAAGNTDRGFPNQAFFSAWIQAATVLLTAPTPYGPCLRVDTDLRPRGRDGELTLSFDAAFSYYKEWADLWERQAWIKARACACDVDGGRLFLRRMADVVYREYSFRGIARQVKNLRERTFDSLRKKGGGVLERDIKEGRGAIRDAEFAVQALQLAYGQSDRWVREGNTLLALQKLEQKGRFPAPRRAAVAHSYELLRRAEHWAQFQEMRRRHELPKDEAAWVSLSRYLRPSAPGGAKAEIAEARKRLALTFKRVIGELEGKLPGEEDIASLLGSETLRKVVEGVKIFDPERALPYIESIYKVLADQLTTTTRKQTFLRVHYSLQREFRRSPDAFPGLVRFSKLIASYSGEPTLLALMLERPRLASLTFRLVSCSEPVHDALKRWPYLLSKLTYENMREVEKRVRILSSTATNADAIRQEQKTAFFLIHAREIIMGEKPGWAQRLHTELADKVCRAVFEDACGRVEEGEKIEPGTLSDKLSLLGLGRLGFGEMHPKSDLDLVCVKRAPWVLPGDPEGSARVELRFMRALVEGFTAVTRHGALYDVDLRLRPYGVSGAQVQSPDALLDYFRAPARPWERAAYLKGRVVAGNGRLGLKALRGVWELTMERGLLGDETQGLLALRGRMGDGAKNVEEAVKFWSGGLLELDLVLLVLQIKRALPPEEGGTPGLMERLAGAGALSPGERDALYAARLYQDTLLHRCRLHLERPPAIERLRETLKKVGSLWSASATTLGEPPPGDIEKEWRIHRSAVERIAGIKLG